MGKSNLHHPSWGVSGLPLKPKLQIKDFMIGWLVGSLKTFLLVHNAKSAS